MNTLAGRLVWPFMSREPFPGAEVQRREREVRIAERNLAACRAKMMQAITAFENAAAMQALAYDRAERAREKVEGGR